MITVLVTTTAGAKSMKEFGKAIPRQIMDWKAEGKDEVFDRKSIFGYIDGGAELYLAYGFRKLLVRRFTGPGGREIVLDIFDMGSSEDAFGVFTTECDSDPIGIGQGSEYSDGLLRFWKGRTFVSIVAMGKEPVPKATILKLGKMVAAAIPSSGSKPNLLMYLPPQDRDPRRVRYFHTHVLLTKHYYVADENILLLDHKTDCLLVEYPGKTQESIHLLLVQYENVPRARQAYQRFLKGYMPDAKEQGIVRTENQRWTWAKIDRDRIQIAFDAPTKKRAGELLSSVKLRKR